MCDNKSIIIEDGISVSYQRQLLELTTGLMRVLTKEELLQIVGVYKKAIDRLTEQANKEGVAMSIVEYNDKEVNLEKY